MNDTPHEDPATEYERMLDRKGLDCSRYACWKPMRAIVAGRRYCEDHARELDDPDTEWLES